MNYSALVLLLGMYGLSIPGLTYCISFGFKTSAMAQTVIMAGYSLTTLVRPARVPPLRAPARPCVHALR